MKKGWIMFLIIGTLLFTGNINLVSATIGEEEKSNPHTFKEFNKEIAELKREVESFRPLIDGKEKEGKIQRKLTSFVNKVEPELQYTESNLRKIKEIICILVQMRTGLLKGEIKGNIKGSFFIVGGSFDGSFHGKELPESLWRNITLYYETNEREMIKKEIIQPLKQIVEDYPFADSEVKVKAQKLLNLIENKTKEGKITTLDLIILDDCIDEMEKEIEAMRKKICMLLTEWEARGEKIGIYAIFVFFGGLPIIGAFFVDDQEGAIVLLLLGVFLLLILFLPLFL